MKINFRLLAAFILLLSACTIFTPSPAPSARAPTAPPTAQPTRIPTMLAATAPGTSGQEGLKTEWRTAFTSGLLLFETCTLIFETHANCGQGEIDLAEAMAELEIEADSLTLINGWIVAEIPSEATGAYLWRLETDLRTLIELWSQMNSGDPGAAEITDPLSGTCASLNNTLGEIANTALAAGLTEASLSELEGEIADMLAELRDSILE